MGVRHLNRFLLTQCARGIYSIGLESLRNKRVVIDMSIYLYKFKISDALESRTKHMLATLINHGIHAICVFDGKPPVLKEPELRRRRETVQRPRVSFKDVALVKKLVETAGATCIQAPHEADEMCAAMVRSKHAYVCLSDDTDMFVHGCSRVLRNVNFDRGIATMYDLEIILRYLDMPPTDFTQMCVAAGTDYYKPVGKDLYTYAALYPLYKQTGRMGGFLEWLNAHDHVDDYPQLLTACRAFAY